jgi:hypothetical protein
MSTFGNQAVSHGGEPANQLAAISGGTLASPTFTADGTLDSLFSDTTDLPFYTLYRGIYVGTAGNLKIQDWDGNVIGPIPVSAGTLPWRPKRIYATGTTVSKVVPMR